MRMTHVFLLVLVMTFLACKDTKTVSTNPNTDVPIFSPAVLVANYKLGEVKRCEYEGKTIYICSNNAPDAGNEIFDEKGRQIGVCYYSTNRVDPPCEGATGCEVLYRVKPNIWGKPGVEYKEKQK
jgi:hypothetical protein